MKKTSLFRIVAFLSLAAMNGCEPFKAAAPSATVTPPACAPIPPPTFRQGRILTVTSTSDSGLCTLRRTLQRAQPYDRITFDTSVFPPAAPVAIALLTALPELYQGYLTIDASNAGVILDGSSITGSDLQHGLSISSDHNVIRGLQITGFSNAGIGLYGGAQYNVIGGDRSIGSGPLGQGNLISGNGNFGIGLWDEGTSHNTIRGNYIGININGTATWGHARDGIHSNGATSNLITGNVIGGNESAGVYLCCVVDGGSRITHNRIGVGPTGSELGNGQAGVRIDHTSHNVVGPGNTIAHNFGDGISFWEETPYNTITQNSIHDNSGRGIGVSIDQNTLQPPLIINWDLQAGTLAGVTCADCIVEIFSDQDGQGADYEDRVIADSTGYFSLAHGGAFSLPRLTSTATDGAGTTSPFSFPTSGPIEERVLQTGNTLPFSRLDALCALDLMDNHIGTSWGDVQSVEGWGNACARQGIQGLKMVRLAFNEVEDWPAIDWSRSEFDITDEQDEFVTSLIESGITVTYILNFWDKANHPGGWPPGTTSRFTTDEEIKRYLEYVDYIVGHFQDRGVRYFELWNEPDNQSSAIQHIKPKDYVNLAGRVDEFLKEKYPEAKIVVGSVSYLRGPYAHDYLYHIIESDIMPDVDVVAWHPMYGTSPDPPDDPGDPDESEYYYFYPEILKDIKQTAIAHGFQGEFRGDELSWCSPDMNDCGAALHMHTNITAAKYYARGIVMHLGRGVTVHLGSLSDARRETNTAVSSLATILAGADAGPFPVGVQTTSTNVVSYTFKQNGDAMVALWTDGRAVEDDPGIEATLPIPGFLASEVVGIDVLYGFEQELITETQNGDLAIRDLLIKDYPIILRFIR